MGSEDRKTILWNLLIRPNSRGNRGLQTQNGTDRVVVRTLLRERDLTPEPKKSYPLCSIAFLHKLTSSVSVTNRLDRYPSEFIDPVISTRNSGLGERSVLTHGRLFTVKSVG